MAFPYLGLANRRAGDAFIDGSSDSDIVVAFPTEGDADSGRLYVAHYDGQNWREFSPPGLRSASVVVRTSDGALWIQGSDGSDDHVVELPTCCRESNNWIDRTPAFGWRGGAMIPEASGHFWTLTDEAVLQWTGTAWKRYSLPRCAKLLLMREPAQLIDLRVLPNHG